MKVSGIKTVVIIVLLLVNIIFIGLIIKERLVSSREENSLEANITEVFRKNGIALNMENVSDDVSMVPYRMGRDSDSEQKFSAALIGDVEFSNHGGNIFGYESRNGIAVFRGSGEFTIDILSDEMVKYGADCAKTVKKLIDSLDADARITGQDGDIITVQYVCGGLDVLNCTAAFEFSEGRLRSVSGQRLTSAPSVDGDGSAAFGRYDVLMVFLRHVTDNNISCTEIYSAEPGYYMSVPVAGMGELTPVWKISADSGEYYIDACSCKVLETIADMAS